MAPRTETAKHPEGLRSERERQPLYIKPREKYKCFLGEFETELKWGNIIGIGLLHLYFVYAIFIFDWTKWWLVLFQFVMGGIAGFGVTAGAHRYYTHRAYKATKPLQVILLTCYSTAAQNTVLEWVKDHRVHHKFSETDADPHNSNRGFFFAHVGWLMMKKHPEVLKRGRTVDCSDIVNDPLVQWFTKHFVLIKMSLCLAVPTLIAAYVFDETIYTCFLSSLGRWVLSLHFTWSVNSAAHMWGNKPYDRNINPGENWAVSFFAMGEGWHNYHHTFPWDYRTAELGRFLNATTLWLNFFERIGWAYDLKSASPDLVRRTVEKQGDGSAIITDS